jgi:hypothetical protein
MPIAQNRKKVVERGDHAKNAKSKLASLVKRSLEAWMGTCFLDDDVLV